MALAWVIHPNGELVSVDLYRDVPSSRRPRPLTCPACRSVVRVVVDPRRAVHAAHARDAKCALRDPESAEHFNAKCALFQALRARRPEDGEAHYGIRLLRRCLVGTKAPKGARRVRASDGWRGGRALDGDAGATLACPRSEPWTWAVAWDDVHLEHRVEVKASGDRYRIPDLLLTRAGEPVAAIEVVVTHPVSAEKAEQLAERTLPWIEVAATPVLAMVREGWTAASPLPCMRTSHEQRPWRCRPHRLLAAGRFQLVEHQRLSDGPTRPERVLRAVWLCDHYRPQGSHVRDLYWLWEEAPRTPEARAALLLYHNDEMIAAFTRPDSLRDRRRTWRRVQRLARHHAAEHARLDGVEIWEAPLTQWLQGDAAELASQAHEWPLEFERYPLAAACPRRWKWAPAPRLWRLVEERDERYSNVTVEALLARYRHAVLPPRTKPRNEQLPHAAPVRHDPWDLKFSPREPRLMGELLRCLAGQEATAIHCPDLWSVVVQLRGHDADGSPTTAALVVALPGILQGHARVIDAELRKNGVPFRWVAHPDIGRTVLGPLDFEWFSLDIDAEGELHVAIYDGTIRWQPPEALALALLVGKAPPSRPNRRGERHPRSIVVRRA